MTKTLEYSNDLTIYIVFFNVCVTFHIQLLNNLEYHMVTASFILSNIFSKKSESLVFDPPKHFKNVLRSSLKLSSLYLW